MTTRVAFIGGGSMTREHIHAFADVPGVSIVGLHSRTRDKAETAGARAQRADHLFDRRRPSREDVGRSRRRRRAGARGTEGRRGMLRASVERPPREAGGLRSRGRRGDRRRGPGEEATRLGRAQSPIPVEHADGPRRPGDQQRPALHPRAGPAEPRRCRRDRAPGRGCRELDVRQLDPRHRLPLRLRPGGRQVGPT